MKNNNILAVEPKICYKKDFSKPGDFAEEHASNEINLLGQIWPGKYNGENWQPTNSTEGESYAIFLYYFNKNKGLIIFDASYGTKDMEKSFEFVKSAADKFSLENEKSDDLFRDIRNGNSWRKTTSLKEIKKLLNYLKLEIKFPE